MVGQGLRSVDGDEGSAVVDPLELCVLEVFGESFCPGMLLLLSSGVLGEPVLVAGGEGVVVLGATFECRDAGVVGVECLGGGCEGDVGLVALLAQVDAPRGGWGVGEEAEDLAGDVAFEAADDLPAGFAFGASARRRAA